MAETNIEWTDLTWNPTRGCSLASAGCAGCYAMKVAHRFSAPGLPYEGLTRLRPHGKGPVWTGEVRLIEDTLTAPLHWKKPRRVFVNSMSDLFHESLTDADIDRVFAVMAASPRHTFQMLTKRADEMLSWSKGAEERVGLAGEKLAAAMGWSHAHEFGKWPLPNVWLGVSVEDQEHAQRRIPDLLATPAAVRFVSAEPLLESIDLRPWLGPDRCQECNGAGEDAASGWCPACEGTGNYQGPGAARGIDWLIVGGESGPKARPFEIGWALSLLATTRASNTAFFMKQIGDNPTLRGTPQLITSPKGGNLLDMPAALRVREFPR